jgi:hypothetical protein
MHRIHVTVKSIVDFTPADITCNTILTGTVKAGTDPVP